ncbi:MAG TPA: ATP synthase subunit I [Polyangiales bacterium]|nr:ATP synthase subunit I [Polyangiales bacterium]
MRMTVWVAGFGAATSLAALALAGVHAGLSVATGAALALGNFMLLRVIVQKIVVGDMHQKGPVVGLLFLKMGALMGLVYLVIARHWVEPVPFMVGLSTLVAGLIANMLLAPRDSRQNEI